MATTPNPLARAVHSFSFVFLIFLSFLANMLSADQADTVHFFCFFFLIFTTPNPLARVVHSFSFVFLIFLIFRLFFVVCFVMFFYYYASNAASFHCVSPLPLMKYSRLDASSLKYSTSASSLSVAPVFIVFI